MSFRAGGGYVIFSLHLGVGHSVLLQLEGVGHVFSNYHISKCSHPPVLFDQSLTTGGFCFKESKRNATKQQLNRDPCTHGAFQSAQ